MVTSDGNETCFGPPTPTANIQSAAPRRDHHDDRFVGHDHDDLRDVVLAERSAAGSLRRLGQPVSDGSFAAETRTSPTMAADYLPGNSGWADMDGPAGA